MKKSIWFYMALQLQLMDAAAVHTDAHYFQHFFKEPFILDPRYVHKMTPENVGNYYKMLQVVDKVFNEYGIKYWIDGGTLLGAVRHKGMVPWDDDADIEAFEWDKERIWQIDPILRSYGYKVSDWSWGDGLRIYPINAKQPKLDIFLTKIKDGLIVISTGSFPKNYWYPHELITLSRIQFGPIELNCANEVTRYLATYYGENYMTHARVRPSAVPYTIIDFSPADYVW